MHFNNLTEDEILKYHLTLNTSIDEKTSVFSSLINLLNECRTLTGRNIKTGHRSEIEDKSDSWLGTIGYFTVLDQIGSCYKIKSKNIPKGNTIFTALKSFTDLEEREIHALYALRCAFTHDFGLFNINQNKKKELTHHFTVTGIGRRKLISLPINQWDGNFYNKKIENMTTINLPLLTDLIEKIISSLHDNFIKGDLYFLLTPSQIKERYLLFSYKNN
jgi:hypothetical protein